MVKKSSCTIYPLTALRTLALHTQYLTTAHEATPSATPDKIVDLLKAVGYLQIDTLHVVNRAHYVTLWARFGSYDIEVLHKLIYSDGQRRLYEGWGHAASIIPLEHYRYHRWRTDPNVTANPVFKDWLSKDGHRELVAQTLERIRAEGGLRVGDFEYDGPQRGQWYDWKPSKTALEVLFAWGDLMVADRVKFQRVYELRERVLPDWVDTSPISPNEARRFCLELAAKALGIFELRSLTWYAYMMAKPAQPLVKALKDEGVFVEIQGETVDGVKTWTIHRDTLPLLEQAADGAIKAERTTFLAPFDSVLWGGNRDEKLWGFKQLLECYKPADKRVYGYFTFPILYKDQLIGRFDPKLDRKTNTLTLNSLYLEPTIEPNDALVHAVAGAMRDFLHWHGATSLNIEKSDPSAFGEHLLKVL